MKIFEENLGFSNLFGKYIQEIYIYVSILLYHCLGKSVHIDLQINHKSIITQSKYMTSLYSVNFSKRCTCIWWSYAPLLLLHINIFTIFTHKFTHQPSTDGNGWDPWDAIGDPHGYIKNFVTVEMSLRLFCLLPGFVLNDSITQRLSIFHHNLWTKWKSC